MRRQNSLFLNVFLLVFCLLIANLSFSACKGCSKEARETAQVPKTEVADEKAALSNSLVTRVPPEVHGFLRWDGNNEAYARLLSSPWGGSGSLMDVVEGSDNQLSRIKTVLSQVGLDPTDRETWRKVFSEAVFFVAPATGDVGTPQANNPDIGVVFRSVEIDLAQKLAQIKSQLSSDTLEVSEFSTGGFEGIRVVAKDESANPQAAAFKELFLVSKDDLGVLAPSRSVVERVVSNPGGSLPELVKDTQFERAVAGFPEEKFRFATGYFDIKRLLADAASANQSQQIGDLALGAVSFALAMDKAPQTDVRLVYHPDQAGKDSWFQALGSSSSNSLLTAVVGKPILFLSLDAQTLKRMREQALAKLKSPNVTWLNQLAFLEHAKRIGLIARLAPIGQSILPVPDIMFALETDAPNDVTSQIESLVNGLVQSNPQIAGMQWVEKELDDKTKIKSLISPLGVGVFMASKDDLVLIASTENQLRSALTDGGKGQFVASVSDKAKEVFTQTSTLGNLYLDFEEVGSFLENMGGLLSMYAPQSKQAGELLEPERIASIKKMGKMLGYVTTGEGIIDLTSFYESKAP